MAEVEGIRGGKNLGMVKAIHAGINPPLNKKIIWFDDNINVKLHKRYNYQTSLWVPFTIGGNGASAYELAVSSGYDGSQPSWLLSLQGGNGQSAFQIAASQGYTGDASSWLLSLKGEPGTPAYPGLIPVLEKLGNGYIIRGRDETQYGIVGFGSFDLTEASFGAFGDIEGQVGKIGVAPNEVYGSLADASFSFGLNSANNGYGSFLAATYSHIDTNSYYSAVFGRNNYSDSYASLISGAYNQTPFTYLGHKVVFGNGNLVNGAAGLTSGVALLNKSFGTTVLGQANLDYVNSEQLHGDLTAPILIVGNGSISVPSGQWTAITRSNALVLLRNGLGTLPSVSIQLIKEETSGKAIVTKEYLESDNLQKTITYPIDFNVNDYLVSNADNNYSVMVDNGANDVTITVPAGLKDKFIAGFVRQGVGEVTFVESATVVRTAVGKRISKQNHQACLEQVKSSNVFQLLGNTKI